MSNLTDFFPQSSGGSSSGKNAAILLVGGGGGGGAGYIDIPATPCPAGCFEPDVCMGYGGGGGGVFVGHINITAGCTYPVVVGAGGACGCMKPDCAGEPGGAGGQGGLSRFGSYVTAGGGGAGTLCYSRTPSDPTKYVANGIGANFGSFAKSVLGSCGPGYNFVVCNVYGEPTCPDGYTPQSRCGTQLGNSIDITEFHVYDDESAGGGFQGLNQNFYHCCDSDVRFRNVSVGQGNIAEVTNNCWTNGFNLVPTFYGLALIPCDTCNPTCKERIIYCLGPTCSFPTRPDAGPNVSWPTDLSSPATMCCMRKCGKWLAVNWILGNSRIGRKMTGGTRNLSSLCCGYDPQCNIPPVAHTGAGGFNQACRSTTYHAGGPCGCNFFCICNDCYKHDATGDAGVVYIVYDCDLGAATSTPGATNCTPVTGPQGYRSYRYTSSGSFTL